MCALFVVQNTAQCRTVQYSTIVLCRTAVLYDVACSFSEARPRPSSRRTWRPDWPDRRSPLEDARPSRRSRGQERERPPHGSLRSRGVGRRSSTLLRRSRRATASTMASSAEASCGRLERREASARARPVVWSTCRARGAREAPPLRLGPCWLVAGAKRALEAERT